MHEDTPAGLLLARFLRDEVDPGSFPHADHVRVAFEMLRRFGFAASVFLYSDGLRKTAARAGRPEAYHETITMAFLALVNERMSGSSYLNHDAFRAENEDLYDKAVLRNWYPEAVLASEFARRVFLLPIRRIGDPPVA